MPNKLTDAEIKKALEDVLHRINGATRIIIPQKSIEELQDVLQNSLDLINRQEFRIHQQEKTIMEIQNANLINFKATIGNYIAENESLKAEVERLQNTIAIFTQNSVDFANEIKRQKEDKEDAFRFAADIVNAEKIVIAEAKTEAYEECIKKVEQIICDNTYPDFDINHKAVNVWKAEAYKNINNLLNELVGGSDGDN